MDIPGFTPESLLFAEKLLGTCNQRKKRESLKQPRTPAQQQADQARAQSNRGRDRTPSGTRSAAAKKAAETRRRCKGLPPKSPTTI